jgi:hypothetical protein
MSMRRRLYLRPHGVCLGFWLYKGYQAGRERSKAIDFYAFSRGSFRKPARNLIATAQRKSHPLEGSRQEATPLPSTTFDIFSRCVLLGTLHPRLAIADASVFSCPWRRLRCAAPVTHQDQGLVTSRSWARRLPLASWMPQKTLGSLPCPIVDSVQIAWLPRGSNFDRAHGRGVANSTIRQQAICHGLRLGRIRTGGYYPTFPQPPASTQRRARPQPKAFVASKGTRSRIMS